MRSSHNVFAWRIPWVGVVRAAGRNGVVVNRLSGVKIGIVLPLPKVSKRPGYPQLSILWGRSRVVFDDAV